MIATPIIVTLSILLGAALVHVFGPAGIAVCTLALLVVVPMLLLSVAFVHITVVETPIPQAVQKAIVQQQEKNNVQVSLSVSKKTGFRYTIVDNGHTIQVNYAPGSYVSIDGKQYELVRFDFHKPSEEKIDGKGHDMEVHMFHQAKDGKLAVIAVFLDSGKENPLIKSLWSNLPQTKDKENVVDSVKINALELLPQDKGYYTYPGSITTPPCTEDVNWYVLKTPVQVSADQIARFGRVYPMNARPVQPLNNRDMMGTLR